MAKDAYRETQRYVAILQSIFDFQFESFHAKVKQKFDRHLNEYERKSTVDQVGTYAVSSQHEQNHDDNQRKKREMKNSLSCFRPKLLTL